MLETEFLEPNSLKKNIFEFINFRINFKIFFLSLIGFISISLILLITFFVFDQNPNVFSGLAIGFLFSTIGYVVLILSGKLLFWSKNKFWYILMFFLRLMIYATPIIIFSYYRSAFCIYTIIIGLCLYPLTTFFVNLNFKKKNKI